MINQNKLALALLAVAVITANRIAFAEDPAVARLVSFNAKPGGKAELEQAIKKQMDWRRAQKDEWRWLTWEYASGEEGRYTVATFSHAWQDYDQPKVPAEVEKHEGGALAALSSKPPMIQYFDHLDEISAPGSDQ